MKMKMMMMMREEWSLDLQVQVSRTTSRNHSSIQCHQTSSFHLILLLLEPTGHLPRLAVVVDEVVVWRVAVVDIIGSDRTKRRRI